LTPASSKGLAARPFFLLNFFSMRVNIFLALLLLTLSLNAQHHDAIWWFGYNYQSSTPQIEGSILLFDSLYMADRIGKRIELWKSGALYSDSTGYLQLVTNGCAIYDQNEDTITNGGGLNPGIIANGFCPSGDGLGINQWGLFLPYPGLEGKKVALIHTRPDLIITDLMYSIIDLKGQGGKPEVIEKNVSFIHDTIAIGGHNAVKHANGRDWWIVATPDLSNKFYIYLFDPTGIHFVRTQEIGPKTTELLIAELLFSPDGSKMAFSNAMDDLRTFDFDRCDGTLSNPIHALVQDYADTFKFCCGGIAFSADNRFLYRSGLRLVDNLNGTNYIQQYDFTKPNWSTDWTETGLWESSYTGVLSRNFGFFELGPDGRIYVRSACGGCSGMSLILHPEREGSASDLRTHFFFDDDQNYGHMPVYPNYRLGPIDGSSCDTLGMNNYPLAGFRYDRLAGLLVDFTSVSWYEPDTWQWNFGDPASGVANTSTEMHPDHVFSGPGLYTVCLTVSNQYGSDTLCKQVYIDESVDVNEPQLTETEQGVLVYPNPARTWIEWLFPKEVSGELKVWSMVSTSSNTVSISSTTATTSTIAIKGDRARMDVSALPPGVYLWTLQAQDGQVWSGKVVVVR
jgi:hypothetical protein